jgi:hypothetical protein
VDGRLFALTAFAWGSAAGAGRIPLLDLGQAILVPCASFSWTIRAGRRAALVAGLLGILLVTVLAPERVPVFAAGTFAGWLLGECQVRAIPVGRAFLAAVLPFTAWVLWLAFQGVQLSAESVRQAVERGILEASRRGELSAEGLAQLKEGAERAIAFLERTWGAVQIGAFWISLLAGWALARRVFRDEFPGQPLSFGRFEAPDALAWVLAGGLAAYLAGESFLPPVVATVGLNMIVAAGLVYFVRGTAIEWNWMDRAGVGWPVRTALLTGAVFLFLPFHAAVTGGLGLFDTWFDFRRQRALEEREDPFRVFHQSSGDDT